MSKHIEQWSTVQSKGLTWHVSTAGRVRAPAHTTTFTRTRNGKSTTFSATFKERDIAACRANHGYLEVAVLYHGRRIKERLHRLVALAFVPGHAEGLTVNHIDGNKLNNNVENLEWVSLSRNVQHQWETGLVNLRGEANPGAVLTSKRVVYIRRLLARGITANTLAVIAGVSPTIIYRIRDGRAWASAM